MTPQQVANPSPSLLYIPGNLYWMLLNSICGRTLEFNQWEYYRDMHRNFDQILNIRASQRIHIPFWNCSAVSKNPQRTKNQPWRGRLQMNAIHMCVDISNLIQSVLSYQAICFHNKWIFSFIAVCSVLVTCLSWTVWVMLQAYSLILWRNSGLGVIAVEMLRTASAKMTCLQMSAYTGEEFEMNLLAFPSSWQDHTSYHNSA